MVVKVTVEARVEAVIIVLIVFMSLDQRDNHRPRPRLCAFAVTPALSTSALRLEARATSSFFFLYPSSISSSILKLRLRDLFRELYLSWREPSRIQCEGWKCVVESEVVG